VKHNPYDKVDANVKTVLTSLIAPADSYHKGHETRLARTLQVLLDQSPKGKLLELGTGAIVPLALKRLVPDLEVHVTDFNLDLPSVDNIYLELCGDSITVPGYRVNLEETPLPIPDETFDYVLCCEVIEHMDVDPMFMLSEVNRVLKPGGTLIITTPNAVSTWAVTKILRGIEPYFYMQYRKYRDPWRHNYEYSIHSLVAVMKAAGFDGNAWTEDSFEEPNYTDVNKVKAIGYEMHHVGDNIFAVSRKIGPVVDRYPAVIYSD
jgi:ubiquinone/menaquinone biosynthesis C-methylase UbiE